MEWFIELVSGMNPGMIYGALLLAAYFEHIIPPIPGDSIVIFGAYLVGVGTIDFIPTLMMTTVGSLAGFLTFYAVGRYGGREFFEKQKFKWFDSKRMSRIDKWFGRWGIWIIVVNRFLAGTRSVVSIFAGFSKFGWIKVSILAFISSLVWNTILITAGYYAGSNWKSVEGGLRNYSLIISIIILIIIVISIIYYIKNKRSSRLSESI